MFVNAIGSYVPEDRVDNSYFFNVNGLTDEWIFTRTGIKTRSKAGKGENTNSMGIKAVENTRRNLSYPVEEVDLIVGASYSPYDTVVTLAHEVQREFNIAKAKAVYVSSACSSFVNAMEIAEGYFAMNKAKKALVVVSEHNTAFCNGSCPKSGHLWGDGAAAIFISKEKITENDPEILDIYTQGFGHIGKGRDGVRLNPKDEGMVMPDGRDVFIQACYYMPEALNIILEKNDFKTNDVAHIVAHQANMRIISNIANQYNLPEGVFWNSIEELGNTGSASVLITLALHLDEIKKDDLIAITVFGGGYSAGAMLMRF
jgi:3-oxoacyl-[acyl-carrier-protein] synthase-3